MSLVLWLQSGRSEGARRESITTGPDERGPVPGAHTDVHRRGQLAEAAAAAVAAATGGGSDGRRDPGWESAAGGPRAGAADVEAGQESGARAGRRRVAELGGGSRGGVRGAIMITYGVCEEQGRQARGVLKQRPPWTAEQSPTPVAVPSQPLRCLSISPSPAPTSALRRSPRRTAQRKPHQRMSPSAVAPARPFRQ